MGDPVEYETCTADQRAVGLDSLCELRNAAHVEALRVVAASDRLQDWKADGMHSMADWLSYRYRLSAAEGRAWVRAAHAVDDLPRTFATYAEGRASFDQVTSVLSFAQPCDDATLADELPTLNAAQVAQWARARRAVASADADESQRTQHLRFRRDRAGLGKRLTGYLTNEAAAFVEAALDRRCDAAGPDPETGVWGSHEARAAAALHDICADDLAAANDASSPPAASVVVFHVPEALVEHLGDAAATDPPEASAMVDGHPIAFATTLRILCDVLVEMNIEGPNGRTVGIGRASRRPPRWLRRRVVHRDGGCCRWPGCSRPIRHLHHMQHWTDGGPTDASNLIGVCWHHHHLLHEGGWDAKGDADGTVAFHGPYERIIESRAGPP